MSMGIARNQTQTGGGSSVASLTITFNSVKAGSLLVLSIGILTDGAAVSTVIDGTNTWIKADALAWSAGSKNLEFWYTANVPAASSYAAVITPATTNSMGAIGREYAAISSSPLDAHTIAASSGSSLSSGATGNSVGTGELVIGYCGQSAGGTFTLGSGYGFLTSFNPVGTTWMGMEDKLISSPTTSTATFTGSGTTYTCGVATFKMAGSYGSTTGLRPAAFKPGLAR